MKETEILQTNVFHLILQTGPMVQLVLILLILASILCWAVIIAKLRALRVASKDNTRFLNLFWGGKNLDEIFSRSNQYAFSPLANVFQSGYQELKKLSSAGKRNHSDLENINRALIRASHTQVNRLEQHVGLLATTASAGPFVGLFGTVWGIMTAFHNIGASGSANLAVVAPGISEALIATAVGLGAAIPAVVFYNHFVGQIKRAAIDMDCFTQDFLNIIQRSFDK